MPIHIIILRHGKAERDSPSRGDDDRALQPRGRYQADYIADALADLALHPTLIVSSPILRAKTTAEIIAKALKTDLLIDDRLSTRHDEGDHFACLRDHAADHAIQDARIMLVGHNPTLSTLAMQLNTKNPLKWSGELRTGEALVLETTSVRLASATLTRTLRLDRDD